MFHLATGLHCPGCGTARAAHSALNGRLVDALGFNPLAVVNLPVLLLVTAYGAIRWAVGRPSARKPFAHPCWLWILLAVIIVFTVLRNISAEPFRRLAPNVVSPSDPPP